MAKDIKVTLELDSRQFDRNIAQSEARVDKFSKNSTLGIGKIGTALAALGGGAAIRGIIETGAAFQDLQNSLNVVFGGIGAGEAAFQRVQDFAASTQFSVQTLTQAFVQLKGAGVEPTEELLQTFADTASVTTDQMGTFQAALDLVSRSTAGGLGLEDLNRLADRGIPVFRILQERLGIARLEVSEFGKTAAGANQIIDSLLAGLQEDFGGALKSQAELLNFQLNQLGDAFDKLKVSLFETFSDNAVTGVKGLTDAINRLADNTDGLLQLGKGLAQLVAVITLFIPAARGLRGASLALKDLPKSSVFRNGSNALSTFKEGFVALGVTVKNFFTKPFKEANKAFERLGKDPGGKDILSDLGRKRLILQKLGEGLLWIGGAIVGFLGLKNAIEGATDIAKEANEQFEQMSRYDMGGINEQLFLQQEAARMAKEEIERLNAEYDELTDNDTLFDMSPQTPLDMLKEFSEEIDRSKGGLDEYNRLMILLNGLFADPQTIADMEERQSALDDLNSSYSDLFDPLDKLNEAINDGVDSQEEYNVLQKQLNSLNELGIFTTEELTEAQKRLNEAFGDNVQLQEFISSLNSAIDTLSTGLVDAFEKGQKAGDVFKNFFRELINDAIAQILKLYVFLPILQALGFSVTGGTITGLSGEGLLGFLKPKASGGPVSAGGSYLVGENGPEILRMGSQSGSITPNNQIGGSTQVTYNINAVDARSFQQLVASDPEFIFSVTEVGRRRIPGRL